MFAPKSRHFRLQHFSSPKVRPCVSTFPTEHKSHGRWTAWPKVVKLSSSSLVEPHYKQENNFDTQLSLFQDHKPTIWADEVVLEAFQL